MVWKWWTACPSRILSDEENEKYLRTKRDKMGHLLQMIDDQPIGKVPNEP